MADEVLPECAAWRVDGVALDELDEVCGLVLVQLGTRNDAAMTRSSKSGLLKEKR